MSAFATLPMPADRVRRRCKHAWITTHEPSEWTVSGWAIRQTCTGCGAVTGVTPAAHDAYVRAHNLTPKGTP